MWIPVRIEDDDCVCDLEVESQASGARAEQEDEVLGVGRSEQLQKMSPVLRFSRPIKTKVSIA